MSRIWRPADLLYELDIETPADIHVEAIAKHCGAKVRFRPLDGCEANIYAIDGKARITVNVNARPARQRFSIGHELGHWMHDRGTMAFRCDERQFYEQWFTSGIDREERANRFATELLLPESMFVPRARTKPITFASVRELAGVFRMSTTATAIRLVELGSYPAIIYFTKNGRRHRFSRSPDFPEDIWPREWPGGNSLAHQLLNGARGELGPTQVRASEWIEHDNATQCTIWENSVRMTDQLILTLLWWKDTDQLADLVGGDDDYLY